MEQTGNYCRCRLLLAQVLSQTISRPSRAGYAMLMQFRADASHRLQSRLCKISKIDVEQLFLEYFDRLINIRIYSSLR